MVRKKILVIEDEIYIRENIAELLEMQDYDVYAVNNGLQGLAKALDIEPDLILSDVMMPEVDGYELLKRVRQQDKIKNTPFIFLTAKSERCDQRLGMELGADDFIVKPFTATELLTAVKSRFNRKKQIDNELQKIIVDTQFDLNNTTAHELNTPLNGIVGFSELLINYADSLDHDEIMQYVKLIYQSSLRLKQTVEKNTLFRSLFTFGRNGESEQSFIQGKTAIGPSTVNAICKTIEGEMGVKRVVFIDIETNVISISDENLTRILYEIIENAYKFSEKNTEIYAIGYADEFAFHVQVSNFGRGMTEKEILGIGPFIQFNRKKYEQQGSGLGLYIVKKLLELNKGSFAINSLINGKTTVSMSFPLI